MAANTAELVIVGGGILGLAHAYHAAIKGIQTVVIERNAAAAGTSVRNFGMLISALMGAGQEYDDACYSEAVWEKLAKEADFQSKCCGALLVAQFEEEMTVLKSFHGQCETQQNTQLLNRDRLHEYSQIVNSEALLGGLWVPNVKKIDQRDAIRKITSWLQSKFGVVFEFNTNVTNIELPIVETTQSNWHTEKVIICAGNEFNTLYRDQLEKSEVINCQLQMMRTNPQRQIASTEPFILGGLSYARYAAFKDCHGFEKMQSKLHAFYPEQVKHGVHVIVGQEFDGSFTIGDSHHYGCDIPRSRLDQVDQLILEYAKTIVDTHDWKINERWVGQYASLEGHKHIRLSPEPGVELITVVNGQGMTMGFSLAEKTFH